MVPDFASHSKEQTVVRETTGRGKYAGAENGFEAASDGADGEPYAGGG